MALLHNASLTPTKIELLRAWLPSRAWCPVRDGAMIDAVGAYRFDDPAGEVGIETHLLVAGDGRTLQVPLTYLAAPADGAEAALVGTLQHSVLGERWVYDACADPVYAATLATAILTGGSEAELNLASDGGLQRREPTARVTGSGSADVAVPPIRSITSSADAADGSCTKISAHGIELVVRRLLDGDLAAGGAQTLTGTWHGHEKPVVLALARLC
jgi:hypothetical protein